MGSETAERGCGAGFDAETRRHGAKTEKNEIVWSPCVSQRLRARFSIRPERFLESHGGAEEIRREEED